MLSGTHKGMLSWLKSQILSQLSSYAVGTGKYGRRKQGNQRLDWWPTFDNPEHASILSTNEERSKMKHASASGYVDDINRFIEKLISSTSPEQLFALVQQYIDILADFSIVHKLAHHHRFAAPWQKLASSHMHMSMYVWHSGCFLSMWYMFPYSYVLIHCTWP